MARALRAAGLLVLVAAAAAQVQGTRRISAVPWLAPRAMQRREFVSMHACRMPSLVRVGGFERLAIQSPVPCGPVCVCEFARASSFSLALCIYAYIDCVRACACVYVCE